MTPELISQEEMDAMHEAQQALQDLADSVEWWAICDSCIPDSAWRCRKCKGQGRILRWPKLHDAVFDPMDAVRLVVDFWWWVWDALNSEGDATVRLSNGLGHWSAVYLEGIEQCATSPALAVIASLKEALHAPRP